MKRGGNSFGVLAVGLFVVLTLFAFLSPLTQFLNSVFQVSTTDNFSSFLMVILSAVLVIAIVFAVVIAVRGGGNA